MDLIEEILKLSPNPQTYLHILKFFIPLIQTAIGTDAEIEEFYQKHNKNQVFCGQGFESILDLARIVCIYIAKDPNNFLNLKDDKGVGYLVYASKLIECIIQIAESKSEYEEAKYCLGIIMTLFDCYKGQMDKLMNDLISYFSLKIKQGEIKNKYLIEFLLNLISLCFIYDPIKTLEALRNKNNIKEVFIFWFNNLNKLNSRTYLKYNAMAICSIIKINPSQQDKLIINNSGQLIEGIFSLTKKINSKIEKELEDDNEEYEDFDEYEKDEEENNNVKNENKISEQVKNIVSGEPTDLNNEENDEDISYVDEVDEEDEPITEFEKINVIDYIKNTLNQVGNIPEMNKIIVDSLGDKFNVLNDIFKKEEERKAQKKKNN